MKAGLIIGGLTLLVGGGVALASGKKKGTGGPCKLTTQQTIFFVNQAALSKDVGLVYSTAAILDSYGCHAEAKELRSYFAKPTSNGPGQPVPGRQYTVNHGMGFRGAAILGPLGCAVPIDVLHDKAVQQGLMGEITSTPPSWAQNWNVPDGMLECVRYFDVVYTGAPGTKMVPAQVWRIERTT